jgi:hypothetical protein
MYTLTEGLVIILKKQVDGLVAKEKQLEQNQIKSQLTYDKKIKEVRRLLGKLLIYPIVESLRKEYPDFTFEVDDDHVSLGKVIVIRDKDGSPEITYDVHLRIWKEFSKYNDYVRICYTWDFNKETTLEKLIKHLRKYFFINVLTESKLLQDYDTLRELMETVDRLRLSDIDDIYFKEISYTEGECDGFIISLYTDKKYIDDIYEQISDLRGNKIYLNIEQAGRKNK